MADWIHPSYLGGWLLGRYIWRQLQEIYPNPDFPEDTVNQTKSTYTYSNDTN